MPTKVAVLTSISNVNKWKLTVGGTSVIEPPVSGGTRDDLVVMVDKPDATNTGPYTIETFTNVEAGAPSGGNPGSITISTTETQKGKIYWGIVKWNVEADFEECIFAGPDPDNWTESQPSNPSYGCTQNYGSNPEVATMRDCLYDPSLWQTQRGRSLNRYNIGHHGGQLKMYRTEIKNVSDGINFIGPNGSSAVAAAAAFIMEQCWLHKALYGNNLYPPTDGQPHCDGFQTNYGQNITLRGNVIGGDRDEVGYLIWPGGYNSGDDFWNSALILKQEIGGQPESIGAIKNVLIEGNWIGGGSSSINHSNDNAFASSWTNTQIKNNKFMRRMSGWEKKKAPTEDANGNYIPYSPGVNKYSPVRASGASFDTFGWYVLRPSGYASMYTGNVIEDDGTPIPITNG